MNGLQIFNNEEFGVVRTVTIDNEPWFVASDIGDFKRFGSYFKIR